MQSFLVSLRWRVVKKGFLTKYTVRNALRLLFCGRYGPGGPKQQALVILLNFLVVTSDQINFLVVSPPTLLSGGRPVRMLISRDFLNLLFVVTAGMCSRCSRTPTVPVSGVLIPLVPSLR